jgi:hypothetical protein
MNSAEKKNKFLARNGPVRLPENSLGFSGIDVIANMGPPLI